MRAALSLAAAVRLLGRQGAIAVSWGASRGFTRPCSQQSLPQLEQIQPTTCPEITVRAGSSSRGFKNA